jgi:hypothetical protein
MPRYYSIMREFKVMFFYREHRECVRSLKQALGRTMSGIVNEEWEMGVSSNEHESSVLLLKLT